MATTLTYTDNRAGRHATALWEGLACGEDGDSLVLEDFNDNTVQVIGTFNSQTVTMQGSNDNSVWFTLTDNAGVAIALTAAGGALISEAPRYIRPSFSGSTGGDVDVTVMLRKVT